MSKAGKREDVLVSVCFPEFPRGEQSDAVLHDLARQIDAFFRYWEVLIIVDAAEAESYEYLMREVDNVRLLKVRRSSELYRKRTVAASEAIGDIVVLTSVDEAPYFDITAMIEIARVESSVVIGQRQRDPLSVLNPIIKALGQVSGFRVDTRDMLTAAYPRSLLNQLLAHPDRQLALRFAPRDGGIPLVRQASTASGPTRRSVRELGRRLGLVQKLLSYAAPLVLSYVALISALVGVAGLVYAIYAIIVWLSLDTIQPGWLTTSLVLGLTSAFLGVALFGLSMGMQSVIDRLSPDTLDDVVDELSAVDLFGKVRDELNVEVETVPSIDEPAEPTKQPSASRGSA